MRMSSAGRSIACFGVILLYLAACTDEVGFIEIRAAPNFNFPLYLNAEKINIPFRNGMAVVSQRVGGTTLQLESGGRFLPLCHFEVRKDRVVTVKIAVQSFDRIPRCELKQ